MKTAQKFFIECSHKNLSRRIDPIDLIKFARFYVKQALKAASDENNHPDAFYENGRWYIPKDSIVSSYDLKNIK